MAAETAASQKKEVEIGFYARLRLFVFELIRHVIRVIYSALSEWPCYLGLFRKISGEILPGGGKMGKKFLGLDLVDILHVPLHRRLETLAVFQWMATFLYLGLTCFTISVLLIFTPLFIVPLAYLAWYVYDFRTPERGGRRIEWVRNWRVWRYCRNYFPISLHRTEKIDPSKNYLFVYHPHGIMAFGAFICFGTNATDFDSVFPGLKSTLLTLKYQFSFPLQREYSMALGIFIIIGLFY